MDIFVWILFANWMSNAEYLRQDCDLNGMKEIELDIDWE